MEIVTGDRYLEYLVKFVEKQAGPLLEGTLVLKLNPVGLHYVQSRLEALQELEALLAGAPVDYLRAYISDLGDHRALEQLRRILCLLTSLKVVSVLPPPIRDPTPLSLLPFGRLKVLELRGCDLSTSAARGLLELRHTLEKIICHNSTDALRHVFASRIVDIKESPMWNKLSIVSCACNGLVLMDESLQLLPAVEILDLSRNKFGKVDNLRKCMKLKHLDLGFNHLRSISLLNEVACSIVKLVLRSNALTTLYGIENLKSLEGLDLSYNSISNISELEILVTLPSLRSLLLEGNPLCCVRWYREQVFSLFTHPENLKLDEKGITARESLKRQIILASRQKRPAGFGFYSPAKHNAAEGEGIIDAKRKRPSRVAMIVDDERKSFLSDAAEQDSVSCDSEIQSREENVISDSETEIVDLMSRVEFMKKERSVLWLREFKEWMDQTLVESSKLPGLIGPGDDNYMKKERARKHLEECSGYLVESVHDSGDEGSASILEPDNSSATAFTGSHVYQYFTCGEAASESTMVERSGDGRTNLDSGETDLKQVHLKDVAKGSLLFDASTDYRSDKRGAKANGMLVTAIDDIMESRSSSAYPGSPPHYQEDILHRRHNLEEEFMQLSAESYSLASSDSDTSSSDEDFCNSETSIPVAYQLSNDQFLNRIKDGHLGVPLFERSYGEIRHESLSVKPNGRTPFDSCADHTGRVEEPDHINTADELTIAATCGIDNAKNQDEEHLEKRKGKWRSKRRVVSLSEDNGEAGYLDPLCQKQNGLMEVTITDMEDEQQIQILGGRNLQDIFSDSIHFTETTSDLRIVESIKNYFQENVADNSISEICLRSMLCDCVIQKESEYRESKVVILLSSVNKFYVLLLDNTPDGSGIISKVVGCHRLEEIKEVVIGIGLQVLRVHLEMDYIYLFITKNIERSRKLLSLLHVCDSSSLSTYSLKSLEREQVELFDKHICRGSNMSIYLYSMLLFSSNDNEEESWLSRSLFVTEEYMFVCVEDFAHFSSVASDDTFSSYFILDSCCSISSISEMVIEPRETRCLTLTLDGVMSEKFNPSDDLRKEKLVTKLQEKMVTSSKKWKLKWFSEETLAKFVVLLKALHAATSISPLPVRCNS